MPLSYFLSAYIKAYCVFYIHCLYCLKDCPNYKYVFFFNTLKKMQLLH